MKRLLSALSSVLFSLAATGCWDTGQGEKIGVITKVAKKGVLCQTWEGQIVRGGLSGGNGAFGAAFDFTIESDELASKVQDAMNKQQEVKIFYKTEGVTFCRSESQDHFLTKMEVMDSNPVVPTTATTLISDQTSPTLPGKPVGNLNRQQIAESIMKQNSEVLRQNKELIELLKQTK